MSLKSVEMQIALPRTIDAAKLHDQLMQRGQLTNDYASLKMQQEEAKQRSTVIKQEKKDNAKLKDNGNPSQSYSNHQKKDSKQNKQKNAAKHPYKGNFLDFSG